MTSVLGLAGLTLVLGQAPSVDEEKAVRATVESYTAAFNRGDLDGLASYFTADADFVNDGGKEYHGKSNLVDILKRSLAELKGYKLKTTITALHFPLPNVAVIDGQADLTGRDGATDSGRFTAVWIKSDGKWRLSSLHDLADSPAASEEEETSPLQKLAWLVGEWTHEDPNFSVQLRGRWSLNNNFLLLEYSEKGKDSDDLIVIQYFGWDPVDDVVRSWSFDSRGGSGEGEWSRSENTWSAQVSGVLAEGRTASSVLRLKQLDEKSLLLESVEREIDGIPMADVVARFVRKTGGK
jgi:uncharacterized protein (TIGR02246 family)